MNNSNNKKRTGAAKPSGDRKKSNSTSKPAFPKRAQNRKPVVKKDSPNEPKPLKSDDIRLNKYIDKSGACSRRDPDSYIQSGNVKAVSYTHLEAYKGQTKLFVDLLMLKKESK